MLVLWKGKIKLVKFLGMVLFIYGKILPKYPTKSNNPETQETKTIGMTHLVPKYTRLSLM